MAKKTVVTELHVGELYSSEDLQTGLNVGNAGGVRVCLAGTSVARLVIMTAAPTAKQLGENPYHDRIENDILVYTGAGLEGDQTLAGVNKRIPQQAYSPFPVYGFIIVGSRRDKTLGQNRWRFLGLLEYMRHYPDTQIDSRGTIRKVWLFEFRIHAKQRTIVIDDEMASTKRLLLDSDRNRQHDDDREIAPAITSGTKQAIVDFDPAEIESVRARLLAMPPERFEHFIKDLLIVNGFERVTVTKYSQDGGIDVNAFAGSAIWPLKNLHIQIQAKRWMHTVGRPEVAELRGSLQPHARGAIITTSHYSKAAIAEASENGKLPIVLVDGYFLSCHVKSSGLTVA